MVDAGNGLDIGGQAFFHPVIVIGQGGKSHVHQLVCGGPVFGQLRRCGVLPDADARESLKSVHAGPSGSLQDAAPTGTGTSNSRARATGSRP